MKPQPNNYVKINNEEEYDIAVRAFVKAGARHDKYMCCYCSDNEEDKATVIDFTSHSGLISWINSEWAEGRTEITIPQLQAYLDEAECVYEVGDVVRVQCELFTVESTDNMLITTKEDCGRFIFFGEVTAHYKPALKP